MFPLRKIKEMLSHGRDYFKEMEEERASELQRRLDKQERQHEQQQRYYKVPRNKPCSTCGK